MLLNNNKNNLQMDKRMLNICNYHELPHYTNIYSLSSFETTTKRGCIISTSKHLYKLTVRKNGQVQFINIKLAKNHSNYKSRRDRNSWTIMLIF